ncbi:KDO2-lipid IV(A) lauroyltransferase [Quadrisphaera granulorum]|uniref:KDO2-lipid IV(A) lauroyltransferase n=1 Tax=Quadrisphaera granulorum TaxID=317664 RepID=A0A316A8K0_9ACTN|nr:phosphatidylinositol mannoside acyltransferase [Quadrisphaera granulorum]PWJ53518.1 KDO2-lipid IV(A) lauroyltransferase [Quadrisphaera granulorum]SZE96860.1 KDO2-lipid IV(A) lauroyltransferase [Quadrisphaera granulorum]
MRAAEAGRSAAALGYRAAFAVVPRLPEALVRGAASLGADVAARRHGPGVRRLEANLARATGAGGVELQQLVRDGMRSYARYWADAFRLHTWTPEQLRERTRVEGEGLPELVEALESGRGGVAFLGHSGSWDQVGAWAAATWKAPVVTVAERLEPAEVFEAFLAFRERLGLTVVAMAPNRGSGSGGGGASFASLVRALRGGAFVPLLADRDLSGGGVPVQLLGHPSRAAAGPAALALATGAPLFPVSVHYEPAARERRGRNRWRPWTAVAVVHPRVTVPAPLAAEPGTRPDRRAQAAAMTQACVDVLSAAVREHPADWHMLQRIFTEGDRIEGVRTGAAS